MAKDSKTDANSGELAESDMISISVPGHLAEAVQEFVRQLQEGDEDTRAQMLGILTLPTTNEVVVTKRMDKSSPKL